MSSNQQNQQKTAKNLLGDKNYAIQEVVGASAEPQKQEEERRQEIIENYFADMKLRETTWKEWDAVEEENKKLMDKVNRLEQALTGSAVEEQEEEPEVKANTKNEKGNRKVVEVVYPGPVATFKIPDGLDLEDKSVVEAWWVKYGTLHILYVSGVEEHIEWEYDPTPDFKRGEESIIDADYHGVEYSEDEEEPESEPPCVVCGAAHGRFIDGESYCDDWDCAQQDESASEEKDTGLGLSDRVRGGSEVVDDFQQKLEIIKEENKENRKQIENVAHTFRDMTQVFADEAKELMEEVVGASAEPQKMSLFDLCPDVMRMVLEYLEPVQHLRVHCLPRMFNADTRRIVEAQRMRTLPGNFQRAPQTVERCCYARCLLTLWAGIPSSCSIFSDLDKDQDCRRNWHTGMNIYGLPITTHAHTNYGIGNVFVCTNDATHELLNERLEELGIRGVKSKSKRIKINAIIKFNDEE